MKRIVLLLIVTLILSAMVISLVACNTEQKEGSSHVPTNIPTATLTGAPTEASTEKATEKVEEGPEVFKNRTYDISVDRENFKYVGRMGEVEGGVFCDFTASGIEFSGKMVGDVAVTLSCDRETYFTVFIDGDRVEERFCATAETTSLVIASFEEEGEHHIRFLKQTEPQWSLCVLKEVKIKGKLSDAPANRDYLIEFIGDSITCGYGNLGNPSTPNAGTAPWEDGTQAYAFLTAEALDADATVIGCSGIGIDKGWTLFSEKDFYPKASYYRDANTTYYDNSRVPDIVVINLGTNDQRRGSTEEAFKAGVRKLIEDVRDFYGKDVTIIWVYNMMGNGCFDWTRTVLEDMGGKAAGIYSIGLIQENQGGNGHPSLEAQIVASEQLAKFIQNKGFLTK